MNSKAILIKGDASFRKFYRFRSNKSSKIIVKAKKEKYKNLIVYSIINKFLRDNKILTPKVYSYNFFKGIIIIEDFGDKSFYKLLMKKKNKFLIYKKLIDLLIKIQTVKIPSGPIKFGNKSYSMKKYSNKFLDKETDLFFDWYLPLFFNKKKTKRIKVVTKKVLSKLYNKLYFSNTCFVHRDYHVQNLMKVGSRIGVIDSQDALIGNQVYDLVSIVDDVRIKTSNKLKNQIISYYLRKKKIYKKEINNFLEDFNILSVQRSLKIIGIFSRLHKRDNKSKYLKYIPYTWKLLENRINSKNFNELKRELDKNVSKKLRKKIK